MSKWFLLIGASVLMAAPIQAALPPNMGGSWSYIKMAGAAASISSSLACLVAFIRLCLRDPDGSIDSIRATYKVAMAGFGSMLIGGIIALATFKLFGYRLSLIKDNAAYFAAPGLFFLICLVATGVAEHHMRYRLKPMTPRAPPK
jgi:hypothetical protein